MCSYSYAQGKGLTFSAGVFQGERANAGRNVGRIAPAKVVCCARLFPCHSCQLHFKHAHLSGERYSRQALRSRLPCTSKTRCPPLTMDTTAKGPSGPSKPVPNQVVCRSMSDGSSTAGCAPSGCRLWRPSGGVSSKNTSYDRRQSASTDWFGDQQAAIGQLRAGHLGTTQYAPGLLLCSPPFRSAIAGCQSALSATPKRLPDGRESGAKKATASRYPNVQQQQQGAQGSERHGEPDKAVKLLTSTINFYLNLKQHKQFPRDIPERSRRCSRTCINDVNITIETTTTGRTAQWQSLPLLLFSDSNRVL